MNNIESCSRSFCRIDGLVVEMPNRYLSLHMFFKLVKLCDKTIQQ